MFSTFVLTSVSPQSCDQAWTIESMNHAKSENGESSELKPYYTAISTSEDNMKFKILEVYWRRTGIEM